MSGEITNRSMENLLVEMMQEHEMLKKQQAKAIRLINNALLFEDNSDYETALWQSLAILYGKTNEEMLNVELSYMEESNEY